MEKLKLQKLPLGLSTFQKLREENCLYVDKTKYAYDLITGGYRFFLSRPRRFGKSLFVSTLEEILRGNKEVQISMQKYLLEIFAHLDATTANRLALDFRAALTDYNVEEAISTLKQLFAHIPYQLHMKEERFYHALLQMICIAAGMKAQSEYSTSHGRIDLVLDLQKIIYVIEIKFNESAQIALQQIEERRYYDQFLKSGKQIVLLGLAFKREPNNFDITYEMKQLP